MPYPDLPPSPTFWRCPACGSEVKFHASGTGSVACDACGKSSTVQQLLDEHARVNSPHAAQPSPGGVAAEPPR